MEKKQKNYIGYTPLIKEERINPLALDDLLYTDVSKNKNTRIEEEE